MITQGTTVKSALLNFLLFYSYCLNFIFKRAKNIYKYKIVYKNYIQKIWFVFKTEKEMIYLFILISKNIIRCMKCMLFSPAFWLGNLSATNYLFTYKALFNSTNRDDWCLSEWSILKHRVLLQEIYHFLNEETIIIIPWW